MKVGFISCSFLLSTGVILPIPGSRDSYYLFKDKWGVVKNGGEPLHEGGGLLSLEDSIGGI